MSRPPAVPCRGKNACAGYMRGDARAAAPAGARRRDRGARTEGAGERARDCSRLGRQRTSNMPTISVTLEVSQLSGWLKVVAYCMPRVASRAHGAGRAAGRGTREAGGGGRSRGPGPGACTQRAGERAATADIGGKARGGAHVKHVAHVRDAGGVPAQRLVEGRRELPRVASRAHGAGRAMRAGWREAARERGVHAMCRGEGNHHVTADVTRTRCGEERTVNMWFMSVTREVSQLSGWLKANADCGGSQAGHTVRGGLRAPGEARRAASNRGARSVQERGCNCIAATKGGAAECSVHAACRGEGATADCGGGVRGEHGTRKT